jgi:hypothetical protein
LMFTSSVMNRIFCVTMLTFEKITVSITNRGFSCNVRPWLQPSSDWPLWWVLQLFF